MLKEDDGKVIVKINLTKTSYREASVEMLLDVDINRMLILNFKSLEDVDAFIEDGKDLYDVRYIHQSIQDYNLDAMAHTLENLKTSIDEHKRLHKYLNYMNHSKDHIVKVNTLLDELSNKRFEI